MKENAVNVKVSVLMLVYQHEEFVAKAIESVLSQCCSVDYELIIINDASDDRSGDICRLFAEKNPQKIRFINNALNLGMHESFSRLWNQSSSPLIAFCEGDDYWVDDQKLQKQVNLMDQNRHWNLCGAKAAVVEQSADGQWETTHYLNPNIEKNEYSFEELIESYNFHFSTVMLRKEAVTFPHWFTSVYCVDRPIYLLAAEQGHAGYLDDTVSCYRLHSGGNWSSIAAFEKATRSKDLFDKMRQHFNREYEKNFDVTLSKILQSYVTQEMDENRLLNARTIFKLAMSGLSGLDKVVFLKTYFRTAILLLVRR